MLINVIVCTSKTASVNQGDACKIDESENRQLWDTVQCCNSLFICCSFIAACCVVIAPTLATYWLFLSPCTYRSIWHEHNDWIFQNDLLSYFRLIVCRGWLLLKASLYSGNHAELKFTSYSDIVVCIYPNTYQS